MPDPSITELLERMQQTDVVELVAFRLYSFYGYHAKPWACLEEYQRAAWRVEARDLLAPDTSKDEGRGYGIPGDFERKVKP